MDALDAPAVAPKFELTECEKNVIRATNLIDNNNFSQAREALMDGLSTDHSCVSALLLMRFLRLDVPTVFGSTDISAENMLERAQRAPSAARDRANKFCDYLVEAYPSSPSCLFLCGSVKEKACDDIDSAFRYYMDSAKLGCAAAQFNIGCFYGSGVAVVVDKEESAKWFQLAANQGRANALNNLGVLYLTGQGVPQDRKKAAELFKKASERGHEAARKNYLLAVRPELGVKIPTTSNVVQDQPLFSPREGDEPWDPNFTAEDVPLTGPAPRKRRWSFSSRFFGDK